VSLNILSGKSKFEIVRVIISTISFFILASLAFYFIVSYFVIFLQSKTSYDESTSNVALITMIFVFCTFFTAITMLKWVLLRLSFFLERRTYR